MDLSENSFGSKNSPPISSVDSQTNGSLIVILPETGYLRFGLNELWRYRELLFFLAWRDIKVRYKQTILGALWVILQPLLTMLLFSLIFGKLAGLPSEGSPYTIFTLTGLIPWQMFSYAITQSSNSLVVDVHLITKIYFPRLVIPVSSVLAGLLDFAISLSLLFVLMILYGIPITWRFILLPLLIVLIIVAALSVGLWLSALNLKYRDVRYTLPFLTQFWMFVTPIAYSSTLIPEKWRLLYSLNPTTGIVEGMRWIFLGKNEFAGSMLFISTLITLLFFIGGVIYFKHMEDSFSDIA